MFLFLFPPLWMVVHEHMVFTDVLLCMNVYLVGELYTHKYIFIVLFQL